MSTQSFTEGLYALVQEEAFGSADVFPTPDEADAALREVLGDDVDWPGRLAVDEYRRALLEEI